MGDKFRVGDIVFVTNTLYYGERTSSTFECVGKITYMFRSIDGAKIIVLWNRVESWIGTLTNVSLTRLEKTDVAHVKEYPHIAKFVEFPSENFFLDE